MPRAHQSRKLHTPLAKLNPPRLPAIVERPRLYRLLDRARTRPVIWINAPPGFGKTTLVASYLRAKKIRPLWYQVDEGDRDLATFFHYLSLAAKQATPRYRSPLPHLTPEYLQGLPTFTRRFFESLYARLKPPALLVLDNYQEVAPDSLFQQTVALGIEALPEKIGVIVMSRALPPPVFARLQAARQMNFIDEEALRLTNRESRAIVRLHARAQTAEIAAPAAALHNRLQGWVAGLVLQLEQEEAGLPNLSSTSETPQVIFEYLAREVLHRLSPEHLRFLLQTAFLPNIPPALAERLTGNVTAGDILFNLYRSRYFTERKMGTDPVYQYHPLFREFLRAHAKAALSPDEITGIQWTAASLLEEAERFEDAVTLYYGAGHLQEIVRLILSRAPGLLQQGRTQTLEGWLKLIPAEQYGQTPWLLYWLGACRVPTDPIESEPLFARAFERFKAQNDRVGMLMACAGVLSSIQYSWLDLSKLDRWIDIMLDLVSSDVSFPSPEIESQVTFPLLNALMWRCSRASVITPWIDRAKKLIEEMPGIEKHSTLIAGLVVLLLWLGQIVLADKYAKLLKSAGESESTQPLTRLVYHANASMLAWFFGDPAQTVHHGEQGLEISQNTGVHVFDSTLLGVCVYGALFQGDVISAEQYLNRLCPLVAHPDHMMRANFLYQQAWVHRIRGELSRAWTLIQEGIEVKGLKGSPFPEAHLSYAAADLLHALGKTMEARQYLNRVEKIAQDMESLYVRYVAQLLKAFFAFDHEKEVEARAILQQALAIGHQQDFTYIYWWMPDMMARLCAQALEAEIEVDYVRKLICKTKLLPVGQAATNEAWPWAVKIYTLGRFEIFLDGKPLPSPRKAPYRVLALLKAMIAMGGRDIPTSRLIDALWPDAEGDAGAETFHKTLQRLRHLLCHDSLIQMKEGTVSLNRQLCWIDAMAFQSLLNGTDDSKPRQVMPDAKVRRYEQAIVLYRGPFLDGDVTYEWTDRCRERLRHQFVQTVQHVSEWKKAAGQEEAAVACLESGLETDALAEPLYPHLIRFLSNLERQDEAKHVLARYRKAVIIAGREPSVEMQRLAKNLSSS